MIQTPFPPLDESAGEPTEASAPPAIEQVGGVAVPRAPASARETGVDESILIDLTLKMASTTPRFTTEWAAQKLHLPRTLVGEFLHHLHTDHYLQVLGQAAPFGSRYAITEAGRQRARQLLNISGYVGPAPVSLASYTSMLDWQLAQFPKITPALVTDALADLVVPPETAHLAGLALSAGRSLFLSGPPGNGKTSIGHLLHRALPGSLWIPHCLGVDQHIIEIYDPQIHQAVPVPVGERTWMIDQRWVRIKRPLIVGGGEMTLDALDLRYSPSLGYYEAPLPLKTNGGTLLIDDFGRQRVDPFQMLNRWIIPLESQLDYLTLMTGQKIQVPFRLMLIIATNLKLETVTDAAFLRRIGYRLVLADPTPERYATIFESYAKRRDLQIPPGLLTRLLEHYRAEQRELRCCEPRDLIERCLQICRFESQPAQLTDNLLDLAWRGYFGPERGAPG